VFGLAILAAVAQAMDLKYGENGSPQKGLGCVGYKSVYYSCMILSVIGLLISIIDIRVPDGMSGSIWQIKADTPSTVVPSSLELDLGWAKKSVTSYMYTVYSFDQDHSRSVYISAFIR
jgi:hypothetical protein